jgi:6-phosphogluconate dehydrogenase
LLEQTTGTDVRATEDIDGFLGALPQPRLILLMVPAGAAVDEVIQDLGLHRLRAGDVLVDCGSSHFADTRLRQITLEENGIHLLGVGFSGGEEGVLSGPSVMAGGSREAWERARPVFEAIAARFQGEPCVAYCGPGPAGHYVKMVHTGIAYGQMLLVAETYDLMKRGLELRDNEMRTVYLDWSRTEVGSYLLEITAEILVKVDKRTGEKLIDVIWPVLKGKGAGTWASQEAMELRVPVPAIYFGVAMRDLSIFEAERTAASQLLSGPNMKLNEDQSVFLGRLRNALQAGMLLTYAQGMGLLRTASRLYGYGLDLGHMARVWSNGSILRSALLKEIAAAYQACPELTSLLLAPSVAKELSALQEDLRTVVAGAIMAGIPLPGFAASLGYYDTFRSTWMPTNLIQAQRDYFGAHTYERVGARGVFHTKWPAEAGARSAEHTHEARAEAGTTCTKDNGLN